ncbi:MAG: hypothetical protein ACYTFA_17845, partial [Planctomycetota bacterium]
MCTTSPIDHGKSARGRNTRRPYGLLLLLGTAMAVAVPGARGDVFNFTGLGDGTDWHDPDNWDGLGGLPGSGDDVVIGAAFDVVYSSGTTQVRSVTCDGSLLAAGGSLTITHGGGISSDIVVLTLAEPAVFRVAQGLLEVDDYDQSGGLLGGSGVVSIESSGSWTGGTMTDSGRTATGPSGIVDVTSILDCFLDNGRELRVSRGTVLALNAGSLVLGDGAHIQNAGTFEVRSDSDIVCDTSCTGASITSLGTFVKNDGSGVTAVGVPFTSSGHLVAQIGELRFEAGFTQTGGHTRI